MYILMCVCPCVHLPRFSLSQNCESQHGFRIHRASFREKENRSLKNGSRIYETRFPLSGEWKLVIVTLTSRRQISALLAIKVPPYRAIGRNNSVINLESFRGGPNSTLSLETKGERRNAGRLASSDPSPMGTTSLCLAAIKQSIYSWCRGRLRLQLIIQPGCPLMKPRKTGGLKNCGPGRSEERKRSLGALLETGSRSITSKLNLDRYREIQISKIRIIIRVNDSFSVVCRW